MNELVCEVASGRLPGKKYFGGNFSKQLVLERMAGLNDYIQAGHREDGRWLYAVHAACMAW